MKEATASKSTEPPKMRVKNPLNSIVVLNWGAPDGRKGPKGEPLEVSRLILAPGQEQEVPTADVAAIAMTKAGEALLSRLETR